MNKKRIFLIGLILLVSLFIIDYSLEYKSFSQYNQSPLHLITPDGTNQPYHPSVIFVKDGWNGYKYWMAETPYPLGKNGDWNGIPPYRARWENPCIHVSKDGIHWSNLKGLVNPIDDLNKRDIANKNYYSDTQLVLKNDTLECYYRYSKSPNDSVWILRKRSVDGIHWGKREVLVNLKDSLVIHSGLGNMVISPTITYHPKIGYTMWYVDRVKGHKNICVSHSSDAKKWTKKIICNLSDKKVNPWHIDVLHDYNRFYLVTYDYDHNNLTLWESYDGLNFTRLKKVLSPSPSIGSFYSSGLYRSSLIRDDKGYKLYFSAFYKRTNIGLMSGYSLSSMKIQSPNGNFISFGSFFNTYLRIKKQKIHSLYFRG